MSTRSTRRAPRAAAPRTLFRRLAGPIAGAALMLPASASAQAPPPTPAPPVAPPGATVSFDQKCYTPGDAMVQTGRGFAPNVQVLQIAAFTPIGGTTVLRSLSVTVPTDAAGNFALQIRAPQLSRPSDRSEQALSIFTDPAVVSDPSLAGNGPTVEWTLSGWSVKIPEWASRTGDPARSMTVDTYGWTGGHANLYAHYYRGSTRIRSVKIGALTGPCGNLKKKVKQFPFKGVKAGEWRVFFSDTAVLDKTSDAWIRRTVVVPRSKATA
jgi:hypothetical protein